MTRRRRQPDDPLTKRERHALEALQHYYAGAAEGASVAWLARRLGVCPTWARTLAARLVAAGAVEASAGRLIPLSEFDASESDA